uniref:Heteropteran venom family 2 protein 13 n=1 Tax=Oncocephalus sp. TaxID=2944721 RepID=A0AB38ZES9_9HEMI
MADIRKLGVLAVFFFVLLASSDGGGPDRDYNEYEKLVLADLKAQQEAMLKSRGSHDAMDKPACWLEDFTAACCIKMRYSNKTKDGKLEIKKHRACIEAGIEFGRIKAFVRAVYDGRIIGNIFSYNLGKYCWPLPQPLDKLSVCVWVWHVNVSMAQKFAEICFLFTFTDYVHVRFDCLRWEDGNFKFHNKVLPKKEQAMFTLYVTTKSIKIEIKSNYLIKFWKSLKVVWEKIKGLFGKSKDMNKWVLKKYD